MKSKKVYINEFEKIKNFKINEVVRKFEAAKKRYYVNKNSTLKRLDESINIAKRVGIKEPYDGIVSTPSKEKNTILKAEINNQNKPLYFRGYKVLNAEKKSLKRRVDELLFMPETSEYESKLNYYNKTTMDGEKIKTFGWKLDSFKTIKTVNVSSGLIITISLFLGLGIGLCIVVFPYSLK
ncbi:hypothetical protein [Zooshikella ganghwensis]|uniref:Uncharacterized protein n=1 Tax=Zooshikella ganghwensis TaxID=202772 RepID=A0A4P9VIX8_9GAMM|nr:hypothetical protein [Zooshikella ganghwensis]RDH43195.1 hypothetical protein B9G39_06945 [Zooshikella ganghwensis]